MLKKLFKKIGKFVKRGLKKVGSFFKRAFKGVGKFIGKLGPVGMLGMMLIMPQLGSWWSQFGEWAGTLAQPFKFGMKAIHEAGSLVGKAYSTVTEGIDSIIGGFADTVGLGDHYKDFKSWMDTKMNEARDFVGLETTTPVTDLTTPPEGVSSDPQYSTGDKTWREGAADWARQQGAPNELIDIPGASERSLMSPQQDVRLQNISTQTTDSQLFGGRGTPSFESLDDVKSFITQAETSGYSFSPEEMSTLNAETVRLGGASTKEKSFFDKVVDKGKKAYGGFESVKGVLQEFGYGEEDYDPYYGAFVADNYVPMYESAQFDWTQQGYAGMPAYGIGNLNYFESISNAFGTDPYYQWIAQQQPRSA